MNSAAQRAAAIAGLTYTITNIIDKVGDVQHERRTRTRELVGNAVDFALVTAPPEQRADVAIAHARRREAIGAIGAAWLTPRVDDALLRALVEDRLIAENAARRRSSR